MRVFIVSVFILASILQLSCKKDVVKENKSSERPNIVILFTDDQGTLDLGSFGSNDLYTPNLDELARNGVKFTQAYAHTVCCPARASLMTGRYPQRCNVNSWVQNVPGAHNSGENMYLSEVTLAEILKPLGYKTGLFGKWHLGGSIDHGPLSQGFDEFYGIRGGFVDNYVHYMLHGEGEHDLWENKKEIFKEGQYFPDLITSKAVDFINKNERNPFLLYLSFNIPHYPEQPDGDLDTKYEDVPEPRKSYGKIVSTVDARIGQVMDKLKELDLLDNTLVFFISDNGHSNEDYQIIGKNHKSGLPEGTNYGANGGGGNTGKWRGSKGSYFEGGIRVPAIISYPKLFPQNETRNQIITIMDFMPTMCDVLNIPLPSKKIDGKTILPIIGSPHAQSEHEVLHFQWRDSWAIRDGKWKLIVNGKNERWSKDPAKQHMDSIFLANLDDQSPEMTNYAESETEIVERLTALHRDWSKEVQKTD